MDGQLTNKMAKALSDKHSKVQRKHMRLRFQRLVRSVMFNMDWLEDTEDQGIVMNAKKNVAFLIRQRRKTGILTVAERALLRTPHEMRSIEDRKKLCKIVASLPCFASLPPKLRVRLIPYLTIRTIGDGHKLIRQGDKPLLVYFVISGEIEMKKAVYDKNTKKVTVNSEAILSVGDIIGDVELLECCCRLTSYATRTPCEILQIMDDEFHLVIGKFMSDAWMQKKMAIKSLSYFSFFTEEQLVRACSYCQLVKYDPLHSIYSEDKGAVSCVHFVLNGECLILQCLQVQVDGKKGYKLQKVDETDYLTTSLGPNQTSTHNLADLGVSSSGSSDSKKFRVKKKGPKVSLRDIELACGADKIPDRLLHRSKKTHSAFKRRVTELSYHPTLRGALISEDEVDDKEIFEESECMYYCSDEDISLDDSTWRQSGVSIQQSREASKSKRHSINSLSRRRGGTSLEESLAKGISCNSPSRILHLETRFMDVGSLTTGAIFGLGEKIIHRVIMARTVVQCLLLPRYWLLHADQNPGDMWIRLRFYLEHSIPSREEVFKSSLQTRQWEKLRSQYVQSTLNPDSVNDTHPEDIPIFGRIVETRDAI